MSPSNSKTSKTLLRERLRIAIGGVTKHYPAESTLTLGGASYTPAAIVKVFQDLLDAADAADAQKAKWRELVVAVTGKTPTSRQLLRALKALVTVQFSNGAAALDDFGFATRKVSKPTVATKASAVEKAAATRKSHGTMGKKQRKKADAAAAQSKAQASTVSTVK